MTTLNQAQLAALDGYLMATTVGEGVFFNGILDDTPDGIFIKKLLSVEPWKSLLTEFDAWNICFRRINSFNHEIPLGYSGPLKDAPGGAGVVDKIRRNLIAYFESLPRRYYAYFPLITLPPLGGEVQLTQDISLVDTEAPGERDKPLTHAPKGLRIALGEHPHLAKNTRYIRIAVDGASNAALTSNAMTNALAQLKHFLFLAQARGVFQDKYFVGLPQRFPVVSMTEIEDRVELVSLSLSEEFDQYLRQLSYNSENVLYFDSSQGRTLLSGINRPPVTPEEFSLAIRFRFGKSLQFLAIPRDDPNSVRIKAATEWWIDANVSQNQTIRFLQYCLGLEALLGEPNDERSRTPERGITERLADRYAYLLGKTQASRTELRNKFRAIYNQRGDLVHQRAVTLPKPSSAHIEAGAMLYLAIAQEINNYLGSISSE